MFKKMAVGKKIILGFSSILMLLVIVGSVAFYALNKSSDGFTHYREMARDTNLAGSLQANMLMVRMNVKDYLITGSEKDLEQYRDYFKKTEGFQAEAQKEIQDPDRAAKIDEVEGELAQYKSAFAQVVQYKQQRNKYVNEVLNVKGPLMENTLTDIMLSANRDGDLTAAFHTGIAMKHMLLARLYMAKFLDTNDQKADDRVQEEFGKMQDRLNVLDKELQNPERRRLLATVINAKDVYTKVFSDLTKTIYERNDVIQNNLDRIGPVIAQKVEDVKIDIKATQDDLGPKMVASNSRSMTVIIGVGLFALVTGVFLMIIITRGITGPLNRVIEGLNNGADQVASASEQVSSSSQQLAEGASEQAASIEETSSSLEEMASMTKQNADNSHQADNLMKEANKVVIKANASMSDLTTSMDEISKASEETFKIIKTIDEIAFQTNLLALNAAVEAARAGEAGAGFAVVADEVRNLAMRAAEAAKNTASLIEGTVKKVNDGSELVSKTNKEFTQVAESSAKVGELIGEIAAASNEQAQGIEQVNKAVVEMDKVVQTNAANAEESASASEEMNAQAVQMKDFVGALLALVGGSGNGESGSPYSKGKSPKSEAHGALAPPLRRAYGRELMGQKTDEVRPEQIIPLDDDSFKDF